MASMFWSILFCFVLSCSVLYCSGLFWSALLCLVSWFSGGTDGLTGSFLSTEECPGVVGLQEVSGKHLLKAEPLNAILDPQYFVRQVHECVMRVLSDRMAKEQQSADQAALYRSAYCDFCFFCHSS